MVKHYMVYMRINSKIKTINKLPTKPKIHTTIVHAYILVS